MAKSPHVMVVSSPAQGHVMPILELAHRLADHGVKVTFVNAESIHAQVMAAPLESEKAEEHSNHRRIRLVSIPDGLAAGSREDMSKVMCAHFEELVRKVNESNDGEMVTCVIADLTMGWALEIAKKLGIKGVAFWAMSSGVLALILHIPILIKAGIIDIDGNPTKMEMIRLSPTMPAMSTYDLPWIRTSDPTMRKFIFRLASTIHQSVEVLNYFLCNSMHELEPAICDLIPGSLPIGPCIMSNQLGHFWPADSTCLTWLDKQPARSVIYVAFGSIATFNQHQFDELALGLELVGHPFLWVVRPDFITGLVTTYPDGFRERVVDHGYIVSWAPQQKVLAHPSVTCFITHCGWNSTMEGLRFAVPFLCWPCFADQFYNQSNICDVWNVGLRLNPDEKGIVSREEIKIKVETLLSGEGIRGKALELKEIARKAGSEGGSSCKNFEKFLEQIKS